MKVLYCGCEDLQRSIYGIACEVKKIIAKAINLIID